jgi:hypothetical protein
MILAGGEGADRLQPVGGGFGEALQRSRGLPSGPIADLIGDGETAMAPNNRRQDSQPSEDSGRWRRLSRWLLAVVGIVALVLATVIAWGLQLRIPEVPKDRHGWLLLDVSTRSGMTWTGLICQALSVVGSLVVTARAQVRASVTARAKNEQVDKRLTIVNGIVSPLVGIAGQLACTTDKELRDKHAGEAARAALATLHDLYGGTAGGEARVCYYEVRGEAPHRELVPAGHHGRPRPPRRTVYEDDLDRGHETFKALDEGKARGWSSDDVTEAPPGWHDGKSYKAFIAYAVGAGGNLFGMITVDSPNPKAFRDTADLQTVQLVADQYGVIQAILAWPLNGPETSSAHWKPNLSPRWSTDRDGRD